MKQRDDAWLRHQQQRWMRHDAARWIRPDAARFLKPGTDPAEVYPALERKYPGQPRLPAGSDGPGWFTFGRMNGAEGIADRPHVYITKPDEVGEEDEGDDFWSGLQLAGEVPEGLGAPSDEPPEIPEQKPKKSRDVTRYLRAVSSWIFRNVELADDLGTVISNFAQWLQDRDDLIRANLDPPKTLQQLMDGVGKRRPGYDDHHIIEQTALEKWGVVRSQIDDPSNIVSIPRLKHYQITGWYMTKNADYGGLSPREYLNDKSIEERRRVGLDALILFKVLKP